MRICGRGSFLLLADSPGLCPRCCPGCQSCFGDNIAQERFVVPEELPTRRTLQSGAHMTLMGLLNSLSQDFPGIYCHPSTDRQNPNRPFLTFEHGRAIAKAMSTVPFFVPLLFSQLKLGSSEGTLSGHIEFDRDGVRRNFLVTVIDLSSDTKSAFNKKEVLLSLNHRHFHCWLCSCSFGSIPAVSSRIAPRHSMYGRAIRREAPRRLCALLRCQQKYCFLVFNHLPIRCVAILL